MDVTEELGLDFVHDAGPTGTYFLPQIVGSGAALFDFNNDGRLDIFLLQNAGPQSRSTNRLFRQLHNGRFQDVTAGSGLGIAGYNMGVAIGDVNNDGWPDVLVTQYGGLKLFLNNGNSTFTDVTKEAGLHSPLWGTAASFLDYNRDGWLDLVVVNYVNYDPTVPCIGVEGQKDYCHPGRFGGAVPKLYRNLGVNKKGVVRFEDVTVSSGLARLPGPALGVVCADFDGDRWPDIFIANDAQPNRLWINQRNGTFKDEAVERGVAHDGMGRTQANMGVALGDVSGRGLLLDLFVTHLNLETNTLWLQEERGLYRDRTVAARLGNPHWRGTGWGTALQDFNNDGSVDIAVVNGGIYRDKHVAEPGLDPFWGSYAQRNQLFANDGSGRFREISEANAPFCGRRAIGRGLAVGDLNGDGALDLLVTNIAGPARLYRNVAEDRGHWLLVRALDPALRRDAYGAEVTVHAGERRWLGVVNPSQSYLCSNDPRVHFGLGPVEHIDCFRVVWPDGTEEEFAGVPVDRSVLLSKGKGQPIRKP